MAIPVWPAGVPVDVEQSSFQAGAPYPRPLVTTFEDGNVRSRPRSLTSWRELSFNLLMTNEQYGTLETFFASLGNQSARFTMAVWKPATQSYLDKEVYAIDGLAEPSYLAEGMVRLAMTVRAKNY